MDFKKYLSNEEDIEFVEEIAGALSTDCQCEVFLKYGELPLLLEPHGEKIEVWSHGVMLARCINIDDLFLNFKLNEKPFVLCTVDMEFD